MAAPLGVDDVSYSALVREHRDRLVGLAYRLASDRDLAEDAVSEVFVRVWKRRDTIRMADPGPYLSRAVRNEVVDRLRSRDRERLAVRLSSNGHVEGPTVAGLVESRDLVARLLETLPEHHRRAVSLRYLVGLSEAESAAALDLPAGTVKSQTSRAIHRMRVAAVA